MEISTYFICIFMTCSVSLVQTEELPQLTVFIQYTTGTTEWRQDKQKINWMSCEEMIQSAVEYLIINMKKNVSVVDVRVRITDCETGNSSRLENIVSDINQCSYNNDTSCTTVYSKILQMYESLNWKKKYEDWLKKSQESCRNAQKEELPQLTVFIQYTTGHTEWRQDNQKINWMSCEDIIRSAVEYMIINMKKNVVLVRVRITDCKTGNSSRSENIVSDINQCSYNNDTSCTTVYSKILQMYESLNWKKKYEDWLKKSQESYRNAQKEEIRDSSPEFTRVLLATILPGVLLVSVVIFIYIKMRVTGKYPRSIKDPSYFGSFARLPFYRGNKPPGKYSSGFCPLICF
ncbi:uncharacterized protein LOC125790049 isoform X2 [Astyanax mexicanus]|uniref:uncharacterized protein LOC125790049 isoform X2 n=1 Tax=Astyanax mexicanus TaxID=7994 RepID=UPI0020CAE7ED|nr:uncharacterized protein LOC125790049 isoform X2 [Astyanax mexicanus]